MSIKLGAVVLFYQEMNENCLHLSDKGAYPAFLTYLDISENVKLISRENDYKDIESKNEFTFKVDKNAIWWAVTFISIFLIIYTFK